MSGPGDTATGTAPEPASVIEVLLSVLGLAIWAAHFGAIYAINAYGCERGLTGERLLGLPLVPSLVMAATAAAVGASGVLLWRSLAGMSPPYDDGGETEPRFTRGFAGATAALSLVAIVFEAIAALIVPPCG